MLIAKVYSNMSNLHRKVSKGLGPSLIRRKDEVPIEGDGRGIFALGSTQSMDMEGDDRMPGYFHMVENDVTCPSCHHLRSGQSLNGGFS